MDVLAATQAELWVGPVLTTLGAAVASLFAYLSARDKLRYDAEMVGMRTQVRQLTEDRDELKAEVRQLTEDVAECRRDRDEMHAEVHKLKGRADVASRDHKTLRDDLGR